MRHQWRCAGLRGARPANQLQLTGTAPHLIAVIMRVVALLAILSFTAACNTTAQSALQTGAVHNSEATPASRGLAFAQANCATCHAIGAGASPRPQAPSFATVINTPELTAETLRPWLQDSHNFPETMNFAIAPDQIDDLAAYMLTLKDPAYRPPIL